MRRTTVGTEKSPFAEDLEIGDLTSVSGLQSETRAFATGYADQVTTDWHAYIAAKNSGRPLF